MSQSNRRRSLQLSQLPLTLSTLLPRRTLRSEEPHIRLPLVSGREQVSHLLIERLGSSGRWLWLRLKRQLTSRRRSTECRGPSRRRRTSSTPPSDPEAGPLAMIVKARAPVWAGLNLVTSDLALLSRLPRLHQLVSVGKSRQVMGEGPKPETLRMMKHERRLYC